MTVMWDWIDTMEDYGFDDLDRTTLARLLDDAHKELCLREPWPFLERQDTITQAVNDASVTTAAGIAPSGRAIGKVLALVNKTDNVILEPLRTDSQMKDYVYDLDLIGVPTNYYFVGDQLFLWPTPNTTKELRIRYLTEPTTLIENSVDSEIIWPTRHDSVVLYAALSKAYYINDDPQGAAMQQVMEARFQVARNDLWMKQFDRPDRIVVMDDNDYIF
jgi:hypothetical protein